MIGKKERQPASYAMYDAKMDAGLQRVIVLASALIALSIVLIGSFVYAFTERAALHKLKSRDLLTLAKSISAQVDGRIERAVETSLVLSHDPILLEWLASGERDERLGRMLREKTGYIRGELGYSATFIAGAATRNYWDYAGNLLSQIDERDPADAWFFETLAAGREVSINFDYNRELGGTFAFVNVLAGDDPSRPLGIVGVGMKLDELSAEFASYKDGQGINLWLVGGTGDIYLSDDAGNNGKNISEILPASARKQLAEADGNEPFTLEYDMPGEGRMDLIREPLRSTGFQLLVEVERRKTVGFLQSIRWNTMLAALITMLVIVFFFFYVSRKIANPYKRALEINRRLEAEVELRTKELSERNQEMLDSMNYARLLQQSVLPMPGELEGALLEPFVIWRPRDVVGGDFYWVKRHGERVLVAVGDCTGHGVPGAFMTMLALSSLNRIVETEGDCDNSPAGILEELHRLLKATLHHGNEDGVTDDGLSIGLCAIGPSGDAVFAGASCLIYRLDGEGMQSWKGERHGIGYRRTPTDYRYTNHLLPAGDARIYLSTDGFVDQNGGEHDYSYGRKRYEGLLQSMRYLTPSEQREKMIESLESYMQGERQRDDITALSFRLGGDRLKTEGSE
ncbi:SpoIIE family protein phosphatase [Paenibacillus sp. MBLB4367]|uniref:SpoIIE family protein phosphatase n=1 Tax=Paenibacillus sp. MBLB4367 TaxID=3384767 RepID=UPI0039081FE8